MEKSDVLVVRLAPFLVYAIFMVCLIRCWLGYDYYPFNLLHSNSAIYAMVLFVVSISNKRYHCVWNRAMYLFLIIVPIFNYLDARFAFFEDVELYLWLISIASIATLVITSYLAIRHFVQIRKRKMGYGRDDKI